MISADGSHPYLWPGLDQYLIIPPAGGCVSTLYEDTANFDLSNFPSRGSTYKVGSGGWLLYSEPNYQGKVVVHLPGLHILIDR